MRTVLDSSESRHGEVAIRGNRISDQSLNLIAALKERAIRVLFIQDFQHLYRGERDRSAAGITDWLKQLVEEAGVVIVLFGTPELGDLGQLNAQLHSGSPARYRLSRFDRNDEWIAFLQGMPSAADRSTGRQSTSATNESCISSPRACCAR